MNLLNKILNVAAQRQDILLVMFLTLVVFMIVIPLPTWLIDGMITLNFMLAILILMVGLYLNSASEFTTLPAIILITTLFRLAISISTTRLILLDADAGQIVETFGEFVVGGSLVVGIIIFLIITIVQFIVITKGAERVAEVGARFSLDAMPGKQMAIDSDLRTGELTMETARLRRSTIQTESQFYGAMDGTMKFVKGDSIAGIVIIMVNMIGGIIMGVANKGMEVGEAASVYTILTIGDGLVSQIPALIIAISAGSIVTRVSSADSVDLGSDIARQLSANQNSLRFTAVVLFIFGLIPGFPTVTFSIAAALMFGASIMTARNRTARENEDADLEKLLRQELSESAPTKVFVSPDVFAGLDGVAFNAAQILERKVLLATYGVAFPSFVLREAALKESTVELRVAGVKVSKFDLPEDATAILALDVADNITALGAETFDIEPPWANVSTTWVAGASAEILQEAGIPYLSREEALSRAAAYVMPSNIEHFLGVQETRLILNRTSRQYPDLVEGVLEDVKLPIVSSILQNLVRENISIKDTRSVMEALAKWAPLEKEPDMLLEYVRTFLAKQICAQYSADGRTLFAMVFSPEAEDVLRDSTQVTNVGTYLMLDVDRREQLVQNLSQQIKELKTSEVDPVVITGMDIRRVLQRFLRSNDVNVPVISNQDVSPDYRVQIVQEVGL